MTVRLALYNEMLRSFPAVPPESGGILGEKEDVLCAFKHDMGFVNSDMGIYTPNTGMLESVIRQWAAEGIRFSGIAHSHPAGQEQLSDGDIAYIKVIMNAMPESIKRLYFPLVFPGEKMISFVALRQENRIGIFSDNISIIK